MLAFIDRVLASSRAGGTDKLVLVIMARAANQQGYTRLPVRTIAHLAGRSIQTVRESLEKLVAMNEIYRAETGGGKAKATVYQILLKPGELPDLKIPPPDHNWTPETPWVNTKIKNKRLTKQEDDLH